MSTRAWIAAACLLAAAPAAGAQALTTGTEPGSIGAVDRVQPDGATQEPELWQDMGHALDGSHGAPLLDGAGALGGDATAEIRLSNARENALALLVIAGSYKWTPFKGGVLVPSPALMQLILRTDDAGMITLAYGGDPQLPSGLVLYMQYVIQDPGAVQGFALSNALEAHTP